MCTSEVVRAIVRWREGKVKTDEQKEVSEKNKAKSWKMSCNQSTKEMMRKERSFKRVKCGCSETQGFSGEGAIFKMTGGKNWCARRIVNYEAGRGEKERARSWRILYIAFVDPKKKDSFGVNLRRSLSAEIVNWGPIFYEWLQSSSNFWQGLMYFIHQKEGRTELLASHTMPCSFIPFEKKPGFIFWPIYKDLCHPIRTAP